MKSNMLMKRLLADINLLPPLGFELDKLAELGFEMKDDCYLLVGLVPLSASVKRENFLDSVGYESFVNSVHVEDYEKENTLGQAIRFVKRVFKVWLASLPRHALVAIVTVDELSVVVKFHAKRPTEQWLSDEIDRYLDPTMSIESLDDFDAFFQR